MNPKIQFCDYVKELKRLGFDKDYVLNAYLRGNKYWKVDTCWAVLTIEIIFKGDKR